MNSNIETNFISEGPKLGFLEAFYGIIFAPRKIFDDLQKEETFTVIVYGILAVFLSNLGKIEPGRISILNVIGTEVIGFLSWFFVGLFIFFFSTVFKTPNNNLARLLGYTGLSSIPFLLLAPVSLLTNFNLEFFNVPAIIINVWAFILFGISLAKSFQLEAWRVLLMAIIPFLLGIFLFTFLIANLFGLMFSGFSMF